LMEKFMVSANSEDFPQRKVADSYLFVGRNGYDLFKKLPYSFVRIDVKAGNPPKFIVHPFVTERYQGEWFDIPMEAFEL
jgi:hypothetical protein